MGMRFFPCSRRHSFDLFLSPLLVARETFLLRGITDVGIAPGYYRAACPFPGESHGEEYCSEPRGGAEPELFCGMYLLPCVPMAYEVKHWPAFPVADEVPKACLWWLFLEIYSTIVSDAESLWYVCVCIADFLHHCMSLLCWLKFGEFWAHKASRNYR